MRSRGLHHVTALSSDPGRTLDFYAGTLGLRLVKRSVNFDAPTVHHFYFGDRRGRPGTLLTFFPFPNARPGEAGVGQVGLVRLAVPEDSLAFWERRLRERGAEGVERGEGADGTPAVAFTDPDGLALELVGESGPAAGGGPGAGGGPSAGSGPSAGAEDRHAVRGIPSVTLWVRELAPTAEVLAALGFERAAEGERPEEAEQRVRFRAAGDPSTDDAYPATTVEVLVRPEGDEGSMSAGCVHHVAFRVADDEAQRAARRELLDRGLRVTPILDRRYFRSIYFREPGGVLFELATDGPGMDRDESVEELGSSLRLPPWLEERRAEIEAALPPVELPEPS